MPAKPAVCYGMQEHVTACHGMLWLPHHAALCYHKEWLVGVLNCSIGKHWHFRLSFSFHLFICVGCMDHSDSESDFQLQAVDPC
mmetsp:Transcript_61764/g.102545  ORF Transcript_61764/g.102545 Transcript_61764/m.102545 type:complete len:84 (-) Transcript_61764:69-320(-)